jgi:hypothetical protein
MGSDEYGGPGRAAPTSEDRARANARERAERAARTGKLPSEAFSAEDLAWAFAGRDAELAELEQQAVAVQASQAEAAARRERAETLRHMTDSVLAEWDERDRQERRRAAEAEARRRLGMEKRR